MPVYRPGCQATQPPAPDMREGADVVNLAGPDASSYEELRHHWGDAYVIVHPRRGPYMATRLDTREVLKADRADVLLEQIRANYEANPVKRGRK